MKARSGSRQLNIRSDEAYHLAHGLARRQRRTTQDVVIEALRRYADAVAPQDEAEQVKRDAEFARIMALADRIRPDLLPGSSGDHSAMYDEHGLPI